MDWRAEAEGKLKEYRARKQALTGLRAELQRAKIELEAAGGYGDGINGEGYYRGTTEPSKMG